mmetsp:Transcript_7384/g.17751  ORF Transcript_7384/g.17751 Transcript_7384/m.17751 type:complete len:4746 (-) Transcript_7384:493-14730(-)|eukprot:CAMPEP_0178983720 /NCGR_PEP_ID=MMETSP0795-20121207/1214_1 /TAXON_ID=88552 /ORGANISM="Amoebophrya sp., Strain Ameob2" /LENGTH=4745 /DNA_ID=CAMNT_0020674519 /DNA_START=51 /DNA_END=14288 /DNA_ORIENTATION=+
MGRIKAARGKKNRHADDASDEEVVVSQQQDFSAGPPAMKRQKAAASANPKASPRSSPAVSSSSSTSKTSHGKPSAQQPSAFALDDRGDVDMGDADLAEDAEDEDEAGELPDIPRRSQRAHSSAHPQVSPSSSAGSFVGLGGSGNIAAAAGGRTIKTSRAGSQLLELLQQNKKQFSFALAAIRVHEKRMEFILQSCGMGDDVEEAMGYWKQEIQDFSWEDLDLETQKKIMKQNFMLSNVQKSTAHLRYEMLRSLGKDFMALTMRKSRDEAIVKRLNKDLIAANVMPPQRAENWRMSNLRNQTEEAKQDRLKTHYEQMQNGFGFCSKEFCKSNKSGEMSIDSLYLSTLATHVQRLLRDFAAEHHATAQQETEEDGELCDNLDTPHSWLLSVVDHVPAFFSEEVRTALKAAAALYKKAEAVNRRVKSEIKEALKQAAEQGPGPAAARLFGGSASSAFSTGNSTGGTTGSGLAKQLLSPVSKATPDYQATCDFESFLVLLFDDHLRKKGKQRNMQSKDSESDDYAALQGNPVDFAQIKEALSAAPPDDSDPLRSHPDLPEWLDWVMKLQAEPQMLDQLTPGDVKKVLVALQYCWEESPHHRNKAFPSPLEKNFDVVDGRVKVAHDSKLHDHLRTFFQRNAKSAQLASQASEKSCLLDVLTNFNPDPTDKGYARGEIITRGGSTQKKRVLVFGRCPTGTAAEHESPVVRTSIPFDPLGGEKGEVQYEVREIGLKLGGKYVQFEPRENDLENHGTKHHDRYWKWVSDAELNESGKPLGEVLETEGFTHLKLYFPADEEPVEISLRNPSEYVVDNANFQVVSSQPVNSSCAATGVAFRRFLVQIGQDLKLPEVFTADSKGFLESGSVLAALFGIYVANKQGSQVLKLEKDVLQQHQDLLHTSSLRLFYLIADRFKEEVAAYWRKVLQLEDPNFTPEKDEKERRELVVAMLSKTGARFHATVLNQNDAGKLFEWLRETKHSVEFISVEKSNFDATLKGIDKYLPNTCMTFLSIEITSPLDADQLKQLLRKTSQGVCLRVVLVESPLLVSTLLGMDASEPLFKLTESLLRQHHRQERRAGGTENGTLYRKTSAVGGVTHNLDGVVEKILVKCQMKQECTARRSAVEEAGNPGGSATDGFASDELGDDGGVQAMDIDFDGQQSRGIMNVAESAPMGSAAVKRIRDDVTGLVENQSECWMDGVRAWRDTLDFTRGPLLQHDRPTRMRAFVFLRAADVGGVICRLERELDVDADFHLIDGQDTEKVKFLNVEILDNFRMADLEDDDDVDFEGDDFGRLSGTFDAGTSNQLPRGSSLNAYNLQSPRGVSAADEGQNLSDEVHAELLGPSTSSRRRNGSSFPTVVLYNTAMFSDRKDVIDVISRCLRSSIRLIVVERERMADLEVVEVAGRERAWICTPMVLNVRTSRSEIEELLAKTQNSEPLRQRAEAVFIALRLILGSSRVTRRLLHNNGDAPIVDFAQLEGGHEHNESALKKVLCELQLAAAASTGGSSGSSENGGKSNRKGGLQRAQCFLSETALGVRSGVRTVMAPSGTNDKDSANHLGGRAARSPCADLGHFVGSAVAKIIVDRSSEGYSGNSSSVMRVTGAGGRQYDSSLIPTFEEYCLHSAAFRLLPQRERIRLWLCELSMASTNSHAEAVAEALSVATQLFSRCESNTHSNSLVPLLEQSHSKRKAAGGAAKSVPPSFVGIANLDIDPRKAETVLKRAASGDDLNWENLSEKWKESTDIPHVTLMQMLQTSPHLLKILFCFSPARLIKMADLELNIDVAADEGSSITGYGEEGGDRAMRVSNRGEGASFADQHGDALCRVHEAWEQEDSSIEQMRARRILLNLLDHMLDINELFSSGIVEHPEARVKWVVLKWILWTRLPGPALNTFKAECDFLTPGDADLLLSEENGLKLTFGGNGELITRLCEIMFERDGPRNILSSIPEVESYFLKQKWDRLRPAASNGVEAEPGPFPEVMGAVVIDLLSNANYRADLRDRHRGQSLFAHPSFVALFDFIACGAEAWAMGGGNQRNNRPAPLTPPGTLFSTQAFVALLRTIAMPTNEVMKAVVRDLLPQCSETDLTTVLNSLDADPSTRGRLVVPLLEALAAEDEESAERLGIAEKLDLCNNASVVLVYKCLQKKSLTPFFETKNGDASTRLSLPCESSPPIRNLYIDYFAEPERSLREENYCGKYHSVYLTDDARRAILKDLHNRYEGLDESKRKKLCDSAAKGLYWHCAVRNPTTHFAEEFWPTQADSSAFRTVLHDSDARFYDRCCEADRRFLSVFANFLVQPHTLELSVFNAFADKMGWFHDEGAQTGKLLEETYLIGQEDNDWYPPYYLRVAFRPLPESAKKTLLFAARGKVVSPKDAGSLVTRFMARVSEGVSVQTVVHNLQLFLGWAKTDEHSELNILVEGNLDRNLNGMCILAWFIAAGLKQNELRDLLPAQSHGSFNTFWSELAGMVENWAERTSCVLVPYPTYLNLTYVEDAADVPMFRLRAESLNVTEQRINSIIQNLQLQLPLVSKQDLCVERPSADGRSAALEEGPRFHAIQEDLPYSCGKRFARMAAAIMPAAGGENVYDTKNLVRQFSVIPSFTGALKSCKTVDTASRRRAQNESEDYKREVKRFFSRFVAGLSEEVQNAMKDKCAALAFDAFFLLFGVTPQNLGLEIFCLGELYSQQSMKVSSQAREEIQWMSDHVWNKDALAQEFKIIGKRLKQVVDKCGCTFPLRRNADSNFKFVGSILTSPDFNAANHAPGYLRSADSFLNAAADFESRKKVAQQTRSADASGSASSAAADQAKAGKRGKKQAKQQEPRRGAPVYTGAALASDRAQEDDPSASDQSAAKLLRDYEALPEFFTSGRKDDRGAEGSGVLLSRGAHDVEATTLSFKNSAAQRLTIDCGSFLSIESRPAMYKYGILKVTPGLQVVLAHVPPQAGGIYRSYTPAHYRLQPAGAAAARGKKLMENGTSRGGGKNASAATTGGTVVAGNIEMEKVFPHYGQAWKFLERQPVGTVLQAKGFYYVKATQTTWVLLFSDDPEFVRAPGAVLAGGASSSSRVANRNADRPFHPRHSICAWLFSHRLAAQEVDPRVLRLMHLLFRAAYLDFYNADPDAELVYPNPPSDWQAARSDNPEHRLCIEAVCDLARKRGGDAGKAKALENYLHSERIHAKVLLDVVEGMESGTWETPEQLLQDKLTAQKLNPAVVDQENLAISAWYEKDTCGDFKPNAAAGHVASTLREFYESNVKEAFEQLYNQLQSIVRGPDFKKPAYQNQLITLPKYGQRCEQALRSVAGHDEVTRRRVKLRLGYDVDSEYLDDDERSDDDTDHNAEVGGGNMTNAAAGSSASRALRLNDDGHGPLAAEKALNEESFAQCEVTYADTAADRAKDRGGALFPTSVCGYGRPLNSPYVALNLWDGDAPFYVIPLEHEKIKLAYTDSDGLPLSFLLHKDVLAEFLCDCAAEAVSKDEDADVAVSQLREKVLLWIGNLLRSPLPEEVKAWVLRKVEREATLDGPPNLDDESKVNLSAILYNILRQCPADTQRALRLKKTLAAAWALGPRVERHLQRKSKQFGIYIANAKTFSQLEKLGFKNVKLVDYTERLHYHGLQKMANLILLEVQNHFASSSYSTIFYARGLGTITDTLLKHLAEYTRWNPWVYIYLEGTDITFNWPENRDRCILDCADPNPAHIIQSLPDLLNDARIQRQRPTHLVDYSDAAVRALPTKESVCSPAALLKFLREALPGCSGASGSSSGASAGGMHLNTDRDLWLGSSREYGLGSSDRGNELKKIKKEHKAKIVSRTLGDFRRRVDQHLLDDNGNNGYRDILINGPPGCGKTHKADQVFPELESRANVRVHKFDCSADVLVRSTLASQLNRKVGAVSGNGGSAAKAQDDDEDDDADDAGQSLQLSHATAGGKNGGGKEQRGGQFRNVYMLDEYHFLSEDHKKELFRWRRETDGSTQIVLIANRIDSRDREKMRGLATADANQPQFGSAAMTSSDARDDGFVLIETRLSRETVEEVMDKDGIRNPKIRLAIRRWMLASRLVFGEESVSCRIVDRLARCLPDGQAAAHTQSDLQNLLLDKVPTISKVTAEHFVGAFLRHNDQPGAHGDGPSGVLYRVAQLDKDDELCSIVEFLDRYDELHQLPPVCRLLAWCGYVLFATGNDGSDATGDEGAGDGGMNGGAPAPPARRGRGAKGKEAPGAAGGSGAKSRKRKNAENKTAKAGKATKKQKKNVELLGDDDDESTGKRKGSADTLPSHTPSDSEAEKDIDFNDDDDPDDDPFYDAEEESAEGLDFGPLLQPMYVDQVNFPFQLREACTDHLQGRAFSWGGDYKNLDEMTNALRCGHSVDFRDVGESQWKKHPITDCAQFVQLLSVGKSAHKILENVQPANLCNLLERSNGSEAIELATQILKYRSWRSEGRVARNPYYTAAWTLLRCDPGLQKPEDVLEKTDPSCIAPRGVTAQRNVKAGRPRNAARGNVSSMGNGAAVDVNGSPSTSSDQLLGHGPSAQDHLVSVHSCPNLLQSMLWAQEHAYGARSIASGVDAGRRTRLLVDLLELLSTFPDTDKKMLGQLWSGEFAKLLRLPPPPTLFEALPAQYRQVGSSGSELLTTKITPGTLRDILLVRPAEEQQWNSVAKQLWKVLHQPDMATLNEVFRDSPHLLLVDPQSDGNQGALADEVAAKIVLLDTSTATSSALDGDLQKILLTGGCTLPCETKGERLVELCEQALSNTAASDINIEGMLESEKAVVRKELREV